jgi:hypothetical protein
MEKDKDIDGEVIIAGLLKKKGTRSNRWGERYFVLRGHTLYYYVNASDAVREISG